jgi:hypothetical protein
MHRSSESVAALAAALAKAQPALANPEKSLTATIGGGPTSGAERSFRYAPLSSGLDIVRKTLGQHEIAIVQTTAIDQTAGLVNLTTVLAHSSGEWISSDWPVCQVADTANPRRMGAALTYARRYALFTLVGIAGEDDLDAPDLAGPIASEHSPGSDAVVAAKPSQAAEAVQLLPRHRGNGAAARRTTSPSHVPALARDGSAAMRERLLTEIAALPSPDSAATWAHAALAEKNKLIPEDAGLLEDAFAERLAALSAKGNASAADSLVRVPIAPEKASRNRTRRRSVVSDKSSLALGTPRRHRSKEHLRFVAQQPCLVCARTPSDAHHLRYLQPRALGLKASDEFTVPLCRIHHRAVHRTGDEKTWWQNAGIDPVKIAREYWSKSRVKEACIPRTQNRPAQRRRPSQNGHDVRRTMPA